MIKMYLVFECPKFSFHRPDFGIKSNFPSDIYIQLFLETWKLLEKTVGRPMNNTIIFQIPEKAAKTECVGGGGGGGGGEGTAT